MASIFLDAIEKKTLNFNRYFFRVFYYKIGVMVRVLRTTPLKKI